MLQENKNLQKKYTVNFCNAIEKENFDDLLEWSKTNEVGLDVKKALI